jgi:hypothetical protein
MDNNTAEFDWQQESGYDETLCDATRDWEQWNPGRRVTKAEFVAAHEQVSQFGPRWVVIRVTYQVDRRYC